MTDTQTSEGSPRLPPPTAAAPRPRAAPTSSRTVARYLNDIGQLLDEQRFESASRLATEVPLIAVALADPKLSCSAARLRAWCDEWIRPAQADAQSVDHQRIGRTVYERVTRGEPPTADWVPLRALKRLRLRRYVRNSPRGYLPAQTESLSPQDSDAVQYSEVVLEAGRRWYARSAVHDPVVQRNLARLAILR
jgi:hypothetical protein